MTTVRGERAIAIVDGDPCARELLGSHLLQEGFDVFEANDGESLSGILSCRAIDLIVLELLLPGEDGLSICRRLRAAGARIPIIILSTKAQDADRIAGLTMGADDYVRKPFNPRELRARIDAILRRSPPREEPWAPSISNEVACFGPFHFNMGTRTLRKNGRILNITTAQFAIFKVLARHPGQPLSRDKLARVARCREHSAFDRGLDMQISHLRKLLEDGALSYIQTIRGVGYMFEPSGKS